MAVCNQTVGKANIQAVFVEIEEVAGVLQKPTPAGFVLPAGDVTISQTPTFEPSAEKSMSLNVTEQFQNAVEAGNVELPSYVRVNGYNKPQGDALLQALMGEVQDTETVTLTLSTAATASDTELDVDNVNGGFLLERGVVEINSEKIRYTTRTETATGQYTLGGLTRAFDGTTAAAHDVDDVVTVLSRSYLQSICRPSVSVWVQFDHTVMFMAGCQVTNTNIPLSNTSGQMITFSLNGRRMGWVGQSVIASVSDSVITLDPDQVFGYSVGGYIYNATKNSDNSGNGYKITAIDKIANTITVTPTPTGFVADDVLKPFLPVGTSVGTPTESRKAKIFLGNATGLASSKQREGDLTIETPVTFTSEVGDEYPGEGADSMRNITVSGGIYFRAEDANLIGKGYDGYEQRMDILLDDRPQKTMAFILPKVKFNTPEVAVDDVFLVLNQTGTALGLDNERNRESSLYINIE